MTRELEAYYDRLDKFLRDNLDDHDYAEYSEALEALWAAQPAAEPAPERDPPMLETLANAYDAVMRERARPAAEPDAQDAKRWRYVRLRANGEGGFDMQCEPDSYWAPRLATEADAYVDSAMKETP